MSRTSTTCSESSGIAEAFGQPFAPRLVADVRLPIQGVGRGAGHHHLDASIGVIVVVPVGAQAHQLAVEVDADAPAHAHHHRLAVQRVQPLLEVGHDVLGDLLDALLRADDGLQLRPPGLELLLALDLLALGGFLEVGIDARPKALVQLQLGQAALVVDRHRGPVLHRAPDVVDADVVPEHGPRVGVVQLDGRSREADERGVGQRVAHVAGEPVDEVVLAAVGLVGDDHDVVPLRQRGVGVALLLGVELLDRGEHHAPGVHRELAAQVGPVLRLHRRLAQQVLAAGEGAEELVVQVVAVGEHHDGRILHRRLADDRPGVEGHGQALAGALGVPHHADAAVARLAAGPAAGLVASPASVSKCLQLRRAQRLIDGNPDRVELVVARHLLGQRAAVVLKHDEVAHHGKKAARLEDALQHHLQLGQVRIGQRLPGDRAPGLEPLPPAGERSDAGLVPVRDHQRLVHGEQRGQLGFVGLELVPGRLGWSRPRPPGSSARSRPAAGR